MPYFLFSWILLTVILFLQQASRYSDLFFNVNLQGTLVWQLMIGLIPNVVAFTCPMAVLVGTVIGLSRMQGDSELVAIRAAGVGNFQIAVPMVILGLLLSGFAFIVNLKGVPVAAALVREVAMRSAISKFESPIEPGLFYSEIQGFTIFARGNDESTGRLKSVFISQRDDANGVYRLITSEVGRMDVAGEATELVLENAAVVTIPIDAKVPKYAFERIHDVRVALKTKRAELLERLSSSMRLPDELGLNDLRQYAATAEGKDKTEAEIIFQRRILMSITPLIFCLLGTVMVLRFRRGGRGFGILLALFGLVGYYLAVFLGEQLARTGQMSVALASVLPLAASAAAMLWLAYSPRFAIFQRLSNAIDSRVESIRGRSAGMSFRDRLLDLTSGLRDFDIASSIVWYFVLSTGFLLIVFLIFTAFETWRFASAIDGGGVLLTKYLVYLVPFAYLQIAPSAAMIATLSAYVIKSRNNELVTWASAGQSVFRLLVPCMLLMIALGVGDFAIQEFIAPRANRVQDELRGKLRGGGSQTNSGRRWSIVGNRIFSFETKRGDQSASLPASDNETGDIEASYDGRAGDRRGDGQLRPRALERARNGSLPATMAFFHDSGVAELSVPKALVSNITSASDNEMGRLPLSTDVRDVFVLEFSADNNSLQAVYRADAANFRDGRVSLLGSVVKVSPENGRAVAEPESGAEFASVIDPFVELGGKPNHLSVIDLKRSADISASESEQRNYEVGVQRRLSSLVLPLIVMLFAAPWAIALRRTPMVLPLSIAVALWLVFIGTTNVFEQYGINGSLSPMLAVWAPLIFFSGLGMFFISRVRT